MFGFLEKARKAQVNSQIGYPMNTKATATQIPATLCACRCGEPVGAKAMYRPGHDARHAGLVARAIVEDPKRAKALLATLPSPSLQAKAQRAADRLTAKVTEKAEATA